MNTSRFATAGAVALLLAAAAGPIAAQPDAVTAFTGARLIDGTGRPTVDNATLLVRGGRLVAAGAASSVAIPAGATRVPLTGKWVMPGLVSAHGHVGDTDGLDGGHYSAANVMRDLRLYADYGVTTVFSLGGDGAPSFAARDAQNTPSLDRARIFVAGPVLEPKDPQDARRLVDEDKRLGVNIVKIRVDDNLHTTPKMTPEVYRAVIDQAHKDGLRAATHVFYLSDAKALLDAGSDFIAHSVRDTDVDADFIAKMKARKVCYCPTLTREVSTFVYGSTPAFFSDPFFLKHADMSVVKALEDPARQKAMRESDAAHEYKAGLAVAERNLKKLSDAGVTIAMGTDSGPPARFQGYFEQLELEMMVESGLTTGQALAAATRDAASCMQLSEVGTLEPGKWADFLVLDADPRVDIKNTRKIDSVWIAGNRIVGSR